MGVLNEPFVAGYLLAFSLICAIGAQNAFVLKQGLRQHYVLAVCLTCALSDTLLIIAGVSGFYLLVDAYPWFITAARYGGAAFLVGYGGRSFYRAFTATTQPAATEKPSVSLAATLGTCLALTWLNPHVYLDTVVLLGSISTQYPDAKTAFTAGAVLASFSFFFLLGYGARLLLPVFENPRAWPVLDAGVGVVMCAIAASLLWN